MDKRKMQERKQICLAAQRAALVARLMAQKNIIKHQTTDNKMEQDPPPFHYAMRYLRFRAQSEFKIGHCKIESERWVPPDERPYQYFTSVNKTNNEFERLRKESDQRKKQKGQERRNKRDIKQEEEEEWGE